MADFCNASADSYIGNSLTGPNAKATAAFLCGKLTEDHSDHSVDVSTLSTKNAANTSFLMFSTVMVFFMQTGFAMLCAGSVRSKNTMNILLKNVLDACAGAIAFYLFGYGFAYGVTDGEEPNSFIGSGTFGLKGYNDWEGWMFQWAFAAAAATIVSGSVAERTSIVAYFGYSFFLTAFAYPVVVHWVWDVEGWISAFKTGDKFLDSGMIDFAGSGVVHMVGGISGFWGAYFVGPRMGRFDIHGNVVDMPGHNSPLVVLGTFILWVGWYGFNPGSALAIDGVEQVVGRTAVTTTLAGASGGIAALFIKWYQCGHQDLLATCNGILAGLVSITAGCSVVEPWAAILAGVGGAFVIMLAGKLLLKMGVDDPLEAAPMHGFCGAFGVLFVGLLAKKEMVQEVYGTEEYGLFYGGSGKLLGCQIVGILAIFAWTSALLGSLFFGLRQLRVLRVPADEETAGMDMSHHGGTAYNFADGRKPNDVVPKPV